MHSGKTAIDTRGLFFDYVGKNYTRCPWGCWMPAGQTTHVCRRITTRVKIPGFYGTYWWDDIVKKTKARLNSNRICIAGTAVAKIAPAIKGAQPEALEVLVEEPGCIGVVEIKWVSIDAVRRSQRAVVDMGKKRSTAQFFPVGPFAPGSLHATNCKLLKIKLVEKACGTTDQLMGQPLGFWKKIMGCPCALSRYPWLPGREPPINRAPQGEETLPAKSNTFFDCMKITYTIVHAKTVRCGTCNRTFDTFDEFIAQCAPDACL